MHIFFKCDILLKEYRKKNRLAGEELVSRTLGGFGGGSARLTPEGEEAVAQFWELTARFRKWLQSQDI